MAAELGSDPRGEIFAEEVGQGDARKTNPQEPLKGNLSPCGPVASKTPEKPGGVGGKVGGQPGAVTKEDKKKT
eukprot:CAMPEP_0173442614 /NCGR_PEP_ID=MMETSP1357-20121228/27589_1 /TAXON_ID=77926 /ORGANISM="Hemiselmis rufescens, Strain PCC563" /LENGTH=72 /DNA_ID=CAMNT_0014408395 /DNA_START=11 /DNA_END=226 /DNA_ORIENTATION=+